MRRRAFDRQQNRLAEAALHRAGDRLDHALQAQRPGHADLQSVDLRDRLHLRDDLGHHRRDFGLARADLLQQAGHALQIVLDPVMDFLHQHLALRQCGLELGFLRGALLAHIGRDHQQLVGRLAGCSERHVARVPDVRFAAGLEAVLELRDVASCKRRLHVAPPHAGGGRIEDVFGRAADDLLRRALRARRRDRVGLDDAQAARIEQGDGHRRGFDNALQRGLRLRGARLGLAPPLDVEQGVGELSTRRSAPGRDDVADDPELAPVARLDAALEGLGLAFNQLVEVVRAAKRMECLGRRDGADRLRDEVGEVAAEHAPSRAVHPLDALRSDGDDAHQHRVEDCARSVGLQRDRLLGAMPSIDVDIRRDDAAGRVALGHQPLADLHPQRSAVAALHLPLADPAAEVAQVAVFTRGRLRLVGQLGE